MLTRRISVMFNDEAHTKEIRINYPECYEHHKHHRIIELAPKQAIAIEYFFVDDQETTIEHPENYVVVSQSENEHPIECMRKAVFLINEGIPSSFLNISPKKTELKQKL